MATPTPDELRAKLRKMREAPTDVAAPEAVAAPAPSLAPEPKAKPTPDELRAKLKAMRAEAPTPVTDARARRDYASANPGETLATVEIARAQRERTLIEDGIDPDTARRQSYREAAGLLLTRPSKAAEANIRASEEMPSLTGTATRVLAPGVRAVEPHPTSKQEREEQYRGEVHRIDTSLGNVASAVEAFNRAWEGNTPPMSPEDYAASVGDKDWLQKFKEAGGRGVDFTLGTLTFGLVGELPTPDRLRAQASLVGDAIDNMTADPDLPKVVSFPGYAELAKRAVVKTSAPDAAAYVAEGLGIIKPREANAWRQEARDARPAEHFDQLAPHIHAAATSDDPETWAAGMEAMLSLPPSIIPDPDILNTPDVRRFRAAIEASPDTFAGEEWAEVRRRVEQKATDGEVALSLRQVPLGALVEVQPDLMPDMRAVARLIERRDDARKKWGGATSEALERMVTAAAISPATKDGLPVYVESTPAQVMRLAGTAFEMLAEADVPVYDVAPPMWAAAAVGDVVGAKDFSAHVRNLRLPTKRGLDIMLSTGAYDDVLGMAGLGPYRPLLGNDSSSWGARVLANVVYPEFQGFGLAAAHERAGGDPTSALGVTADVIDLGAGFLVPAEEIVAAPFGAVARAGLRARAGARAMPKGYKLSGALAKAAPSTWSIVHDVPLKDMDGDTALHHALLSAVESEWKAGRDVKVPPAFWESVKDAARSVGADPDAAMEEMKAILAYRRARTIENMEDMIARQATPEMEALRKTAPYLRRAQEYDALVKAGTLTPVEAHGNLMLDEVRAFLTVDAGIYATPEEYFGRVKREVGGVPGVGAYLSADGSRPRAATLFSGGGLVEEGLRGLVDPVYAVESNADIGAHYAKVHGDHVRIGDVRSVELPKEGDIDYLHASPVCKDFSKAKVITADGEQPLDLETAEATARAIRTSKPRVFTLENVAGYADSEAMRLIEAALTEGGYTWDANVYDAADYGAATRRKRLLLRAVRDGQLPPPPRPTHIGGMFGQGPADWYATVEDILPSLPDDTVPGWMRERLAAEGIDADKPGVPLIVMGGSVGQNVPFAKAGGPAPTIKATPREAHRIILPDGTVKRVTPRAMARITGLPDSYELPANRVLATTIVGNGVPPALTRAVFGPLLGGGDTFHSTINGRQTAQGTIERVEMPAPPFYSGLRRAVEGIKQERLTADQLRGILKNAPGVKADEIEWTGLETFLRDNPAPTKSGEWVVTVPDDPKRTRSFAKTDEERAAQYAERVGYPAVYKQGVLEWLDEHAVRVEERRLGGSAVEAATAEREAAEDALVAFNTQAQRAGRTPTPEEVAPLVERVRVADAKVRSLLGKAETSPPTQYQSYQLPGGSNYREVLFRVPAPVNASAKVAAQAALDAFIGEMRAKYGANWKSSATDAERFQWTSLEDAVMNAPADAGATYVAPHFGDEGRNLLAHTRLSDRVGPNGERILHVEEVQSDWHQAGREKGYKPTDADVAAVEAEHAAALVKRDEAQAAFDMATRRSTGPTDPDRVAARVALEKAQADADAIVDRWNKLHDIKREGVPSAPFAKTWHELVMKRVLREAAEGGYDGVSWTTGVQQVKRYEDATRQAVDEIRWARGTDAERDFRLEFVEFQRYDPERGESYWLVRNRRNGSTLGRGASPEDAVRASRDMSDLSKTQTLEQLAGLRATPTVEVVGIKNNREVYRETMPPEKVADVLGKGMAAKIAEAPEASGSLTGKDLTIGGEGMRGFYDKILPEWLNKYTKRWGGRVGETKIEIQPAQTLTWRQTRTLRDIDPEAGDFPEPGDVEYGGYESYNSRAIYEPVHYLPLTPQLRDAVLREGQPLFQRTGGTIHGSIEPVARTGKTIGYLQRFFNTADFNTLLHEDGHLLRFLFGDDWTADLARHFDHDATGALTVKGEEQAAEAIRRYMRSRIQPNGRLRAKLEDLYTALQDTYLRVRGQTPTLPVELRAMWDATLRPDEAVRPAAIQLADHELAPTMRKAQIVPPRTPEGTIQAVGENRMAKAGRRAEAEKVLVDRARVRQAIGLPESVTEIPADELMAKLFAYVGVERARQGVQGQDLVKLTDRSMVPRSRLPRIQRAVKGDLRLVLGTDDWAPLIDEAAKTIRLDAPQAAAMRGLITDLANEPYGTTLPKSVLDFNGQPGTMAIDDWNAVQTHLADRHAGIGSGMDQRVWATRGPLLGAFLRISKDAFIDADTTRQAEDVARGAERRFQVDASAAQYMHPGVRDAYEGFIRSLGESGRTVVRWFREASASPGGAQKAFADIASDVLPHLAPAVDPASAPALLEWSRKFKGEGDAARLAGVDDLDIDMVTDDANLTDIAATLQSANGITDDERVALLALHRTRGELAAIGADPVARSNYFVANGPVIADAVSIVETGLRRRAGVVEKQAQQIWLALAGSADEAVWLRLGVDENGTKPTDNAYVRAYQLFHDGDWAELFRLADDRASLIVGGREYSQGNAIIAMFTRLYTDQLWTNFTHALYDMGIDLDVDKAAVKGVTADARMPRAYELGSRRGGRDVFAQKVLDNIQAEVGWKARARVVESATPGGPRKLEPAEGATGPVGVEDMEAYAKAQQILHQLGWKYGKGAFDATPTLLPDGSEVYLPQMMSQEVRGIIDRVAKVGVAFADTTSSGAGLLGAADHALSRVVEPDAATAADLARQRQVRIGGAVTGGVLGALAAGPIGGALGAAFGSRIAPTMAETATTWARTAAREAADVGGEAVARPVAIAAGAAGAVAGAVKGSTGAAISTLLSTFHTTTSLARVGMTTGLLIPNISSFIGNLWGAFFQTYQVRGLSGALRAWGTNPRMLADVVGRLWGDGPMRYRLGSKPIITPSGRILTADMITRDFVAHGLDSSFPKSESAEAIATDIARTIGTWPRRFLEDPADALGAGPRWIQHQLTEAWTSIDNMNRVAVYLDALHEGRSVAEAAELARLAAFDYGNLTDFERQVMRNTVLFYSFLRQNIRLFWHTMINDPSRVLGQLRLASGLQREFVEDDPYLVFPDYAQGRLVMSFRDAILDAAGSQQGVATISPPMPAMDVINLTSDLLGLAMGDQEAAQEMAARTVPWVQAGVVTAFNIDPWSGRDLSGQSEVPQFLVEGDRMATGGIIADSLLDVRRTFDTTKGQYVYKAGNEKAWWFYRNVYQLPPGGRSMSTLEQIDRAQPFGINPVSDVVGMLRTYREAGGDETLDAFFAGPANAAVTWAVGGDPLTPYVFEAPSGVDDLAVPRPGVTVGEERSKLFGFPTVPIPTTEAAADTIHAQVRRQAQKAGNKARAGEDFR